MWSLTLCQRAPTLGYCCSVAKSCLTPGDPVDCSPPGFPVLHHLPEFAQTEVHWVGDVFSVTWGCFQLILHITWILTDHVILWHHGFLRCVDVPNVDTLHYTPGDHVPRCHSQPHWKSLCWEAIMLLVVDACVWNSYLHLEVKLYPWQQMLSLFTWTWRGLLISGEMLVTFSGLGDCGSSLTSSSAWRQWPP